MQIVILQWFITLFALFEVRNLHYMYFVQNPVGGPHTRYYIFIWIAPLIVHWVMAFRWKKIPPTMPLLSALGLMVTLVGHLGSFNFPKQIGLAFCFLALMPKSWSTFSWILGAAIWMQATSWVVLRALGVQWIHPVHILILVSSLVGYVILRRNETVYSEPGLEAQ